MLITRNRIHDDARLYPADHPSRFASRLASLAYTLMRLVVGAVFVWSGTAKLLDHRHFAVIIEAYGLIPEATVVPGALALALLELLAGLGLMCDLRGSLVLIAGMLLLFMAILGYGLWIGLDVDCGCFGPGDPEAAAFHGMRPALYRDMVMMAAVGYLFLWRRIDSIRPRAFYDLWKS